MWRVLHEFIKANRARVINRCRVMVRTRSGPRGPQPEFAHGIPIFLDQVIRTLQIEQRPGALQPLDVDVGAMARLHGRDLFQEGFTIEQVIRDYGDVCQAITSLAGEAGASISVNEFRTFNRCLDDAIAGAVTEYSLRNRQLALSKTRAALSAAHMDLRQAQLRALHDSLTGLPNRQLFDDRLAHAIALAGRHDWTLAVMFLDLDQFKHVNDSHGHPVGDLVLKTIAQRLLQHLRDEDTACRNGGDEFLYLLMNPQGKPNIERIADSVSNALAQPLAVAGVELAIKPSIGIAIYPQHGATGEQLISNADKAMYRAKKQARGIVFGDLQVAGEIAVG